MFVQIASLYENKQNGCCFTRRACPVRIYDKPSHFRLNSSMWPIKTEKLLNNLHWLLYLLRKSHVDVAAVSTPKGARDVSRPDRGVFEEERYARGKRDENAEEYDEEVWRVDDHVSKRDLERADEVAGGQVRHDAHECDHCDERENGWNQGVHIGPWTFGDVGLRFWVRLERT